MAQGHSRQVRSEIRQLNARFPLDSSKSTVIDAIRNDSRKTFVSFQSRAELEQQTIEGASTSEAVGFITFVQNLKRSHKTWEKQVDVRRICLLYATCPAIRLFLRSTAPGRKFSKGSAISC